MRVAFDVDDTLVVEEPYKESHVDYSLMNVLFWFVDNRHEVFVWSGGGVEYAKRWAEKLGIEKFVQIIPKVKGQNIDLAFDDWENNLATVTVLVPRDYMTYGEPKE